MTASLRKLIDVIRNLGDEEKPAISLEYFPPRSEEGVANLKLRVKRMKEAVHPLFCDITWGAGGSTSDLSMALAGYMQNDCSLRANLHLTCTNNSAAQIEISLKQALDQGVCNLVALRGDPPAGQDHWQSTDEGFQCALDLVKFIREKFPHDAFGISVAGYPEGHPLAITKVDDPDIMTETERARCSTEFDENGSKTYYTCRDEAYASELAYLKQKVDAGADFIITQMFLDTDVYHQFVKDCRRVKIECPIVPGIMCITNLAGFWKMTSFCKTRVPAILREALLALHQDSENALKDFGIQYGVQQCQDLLSSEDPPAVLHFYTLNLEKVVYGVLHELGKLHNTGNETDATSSA